MFCHLISVQEGDTLVLSSPVEACFFQLHPVCDGLSTYKVLIASTFLNPLYILKH